MAYSSVSLPYICVNLNLQNKKISKIKTQGKLIAEATWQPFYRTMLAKNLKYFKRAYLNIPTFKSWDEKNTWQTYFVRQMDN